MIKAMFMDLMNKIQCVTGEEDPQAVFSSLAWW